MLPKPGRRENDGRGQFSEQWYSFFISRLSKNNHQSILFFHSSLLIIKNISVRRKDANRKKCACAEIRKLKTKICEKELIFEDSNKQINFARQMRTVQKFYLTPLTVSFMP